MGLSVFPLAENSKTPAIAGGFKNATTDAEQIRRFWEHRPNCNIGIATGGMSGGLVVIDCDYDELRGEDGLMTLRAHEREHGELPEGACATTPRGGMHVYLKSDEPFDCSVNTDIGIDIRADGGYVVAPPSVNEVGSYEWDFYIEDYGIPKVNASAIALIRKAQAKKLQREKFKLPDKIEDGERNDTLFRYACMLQEQGQDDVMILAAVQGVNIVTCVHPLPKSEVESLVASALRYKKGDKRKERAPGNTGQVSTMLRVNEKGNPYQTISNCETVMNNDVRLVGRFCYNEMAYTKIVELPLPWDDREGTRPVRDSDYANLTAYMEREYLLKSKACVMDSVLITCTANRKNPVAEWLNSLEWDGQERVYSLLPYYLEAECTEYNTEVLKLFMRAAIARVLNPGCKFDHMLVLAGAQGIGKSSFLRRLSHNPDWFDDNFKTVEGDAAIEKLRGKWIIEMAELLSVKGKAIESVKAFITSRVDNIRPKYGKETEQRPRVCVIAGTTNDGSFLSDPTGNRRFLVVECNAKQANPELLDDASQELFDMCWAEIYAKYKAGETSLMLPPAIEEVAEQMRGKYMEDDPRIGIIQSYIDECIERAYSLDSVRVCVVEILEKALKLDDRECKNPPKKLVNEIHEILRNKIDGLLPYGNGKGKLRTAYGIQRCYIIDENSPHVAEVRQQSN